MTAPFLSSRDAIEQALSEIPDCGHRMIGACRGCTADALLASGVVVTPDVYLAQLAEDPEVVGRMADSAYGRGRWPVSPYEMSERRAEAGEWLTALAAALATPTTEETGT